MADTDRPDEPADTGEGGDDLEEVEEEIRTARSTAEDAGILEDPDEPTFHQSGELGREADDEQVAPPG
ncbi:hypothetical protein BH18ACT1_BH18ACT1_10530 [soil metagenome]|nr:hypothetical protein [Acidimicrobiia bacterium]